MAGKTIYTGDMIAALEAKIDDMMLKLDAQTTALSNINSGVAQSVSALNVEASDTERLALDSDVTVTVYTNMDNKTNLKKMLMLCNGSVRIKASLRLVMSSATTTKTLTAYYSKDKGATWVSLGTGPSGSAAGTFNASVSYDLPVSFGDEVWIAMSLSSESASVTSIACLAGSLVLYDMKDIVNDGAFSIIA